MSTVQTRDIALVGSSEKYVRTAAEVMREMGVVPAGGLTLQTPAEFDPDDPASDRKSVV